MPTSPAFSIPAHLKEKAHALRRLGYSGQQGLCQPFARKIVRKEFESAFRLSRPLAAYKGMASPSRYRAAGTCVPCSATCTWYASLRGAYRSVSSAVLYPARGKRQKMRILRPTGVAPVHTIHPPSLCVSLPHICRVSPPGFGIGGYGGFSLAFCLFIS